MVYKIFLLFLQDMFLLTIYLSPKNTSVLIKRNKILLYQIIMDKSLLLSAMFNLS